MASKIKNQVKVMPLANDESRALLARGEWLGYIEGASRGRILDRSANDRGDPNKDDRRQDYNQRINSTRDGGPVWEMWTVSRDIRASNRLGSSILQAYVELLNVLGDRFPAIVARGRMEAEYGHLRQMCAMVDAGVVSTDAALADIDLVAIPPQVERVLLQATPEAFAVASTALAEANRKPSYFMYQRRMSSFVPGSLLRRLLRSLGSD